MSGEMIEAEIARLTAERDAARDDVATLIGERNQSRMETINWQQRAETLEQAAQRMAVDRRSLIEERDAALADLDEANVNIHGATIEVANMRAGLEVATEERDAARAEASAQLAAKKMIIAERDAAISGQHKLRLELERMRAECEGLRADLLAHPPQRIDFQQYVALKADHEQQVTIIEALQEALRRTEAILEESQDKGATLMRGAESDHQIILGLREALERSDKRLSQAKARQIPPALVGLLGVIRREAAAAEKMIL